MFSNAAIVILLSSILWYHNIRRPSGFENDDDAPVWVPKLKQVLVTLGDTQLVSALAIIIASLTNIMKDDETPLYHIFIARGLADLSLTAHGAAIINVYPSQHNWVLRGCVITVIIGLWQWWSWLALNRFGLWKRQVPYCFENTNIVPAEYEDWIRLSLIWMPVGYISVYMNMWEHGRKLTDTYEEKIRRWPTDVFILLKGCIQHVRSCRLPQELSKLLFAVRDTVVALFAAIGLLVFLIFSVLFPSSRILSPLQASLFFAWNLYDVYTVRKANAQIVTANPAYRDGRSFQNNVNPEHDWGFGQIFPFVMILLPILAIFDTAYGTLPKIIPTGTCTKQWADLDAMAVRLQKNPTKSNRLWYQTGIKSH